MCYIRIFTDFDELHGDRAFADDSSMLGGTALLNHKPVMVIGHQKGRTTNEKVYRSKMKNNILNTKTYNKTLVKDLKEI